MSSTPPSLSSLGARIAWTYLASERIIRCIINHTTASAAGSRRKRAGKASAASSIARLASFRGVPTVWIFSVSVRITPSTINGGMVTHGGLAKRGGTPREAALIVCRSRRAGARTVLISLGLGWITACIIRRGTEMRGAGMIRWARRLSIHHLRLSVGGWGGLIFLGWGREIMACGTGRGMEVLGARLGG